MEYQPEARSRQQYLMRYLGVQRDDIVLDVGCGTGYFAGLITLEGCQRTIGCDLDEEALRIAKKLNRNLDFVQADGVHLPIRNSAVTKILCTEVLEHVLDDTGLATEFSRVLMSGGVLVCSSPNSSFVFHSKKSTHTSGGPELHVRAGYSPKSIVGLLAAAGFVAIDISYALPLLGTLLVEALERVYATLFGPLQSQSELARLENRPLFKVYRLIFPILMGLVTFPIPRNYGGSILVAKATKE